MDFINFLSLNDVFINLEKEGYLYLTLIFILFATGILLSNLIAAVASFIIKLYSNRINKNYLTKK